MYKKESSNPSEFIDDTTILEAIDFARNNKNNISLQKEILSKAKEKKGINFHDALILYYSESDDISDNLFHLAKEIKNNFYGNRIVLFAPLYLSNYCTNGCIYCPYHSSNKKIPRIKLSQDEIKKEVIALEKMGHKRLAVESGEDSINTPIEYILDSIETIYSTSSSNGIIRRVNVNIAATTQENYKKLKDVGIGTYILFQETYNRSSYSKYHPSGPKSDYDYHTTAMDRAQQAGIDDVGMGVLFGLDRPEYELAGLLMHAEHLEARFGVGPHTVSVPRIRSAGDINPNSFKNAIGDKLFEKIVSIIRIALPYTGIIISTREDETMRARLLELGVTQISGGSKTSVGGYAENKSNTDSSQFDVSDERSLDDIVAWLIKLGYIPSFCTACYREGRTGEVFMDLCKSEKIHLCCQPNALLTLKEYEIDNAKNDTKNLIKEIIEKELKKIENQSIRLRAEEYIRNIEKGKRDFRF